MSYAACLAHPFSPEANGAQVPDEFSFPTETCTYRQLFSVDAFTVGAAGNAGSGCCVIQPNLLASIAGFYGAQGLADPISGGNVWFRSDAAPIAAAVAGGMTELEAYSGFSEHGVVSQDELESKFSAYRLVGWGVKIRPQGNVNNAQGRLVIAKVPSKSQFALYTSGESTGFKPKSYSMNGNISYGSPLSVSDHATTRDYLEYYNLPVPDGTGGCSNAMVALPTAMEAHIAELFLEGGVEICGRHTSPESLQWRETDSSAVYAQRANYVGADSTVYLNKHAMALAGSIMGQTGADDIGDASNTWISEGFLDQGGWSCICIRGSGMNPGDFVDIEIVYHVEGVPRIGRNSLSVSTSTKFPPVNPPLVDIARAYAHSQPMFKKIKKAHSGAAGLYQKLDSISRHLGLGSAESVLQRAATTGLALL